MRDIGLHLMGIKPLNYLDFDLDYGDWM